MHGMIVLHHAFFRHCFFFSPGLFLLRRLFPPLLFLPLPFFCHSGVFVPGRFLLYCLWPLHPHPTDINRRLIPYCGISAPRLTFQNNPVDPLKILWSNHILLRKIQPVVNGRVHIVHRSLQNSDALAAVFEKKVQIKLLFPLHMQPFAMNIQRTVLILLFYFNKSHITQSFSLFIFIQITNKTLQSITSNPGLFITIYSPGLKKIPCPYKIAFNS